jgi:hypothetical protein
MKNRALAFAFIACLISSRAFADNPADAPLTADGGNTSIVRTENHAGHHDRHSNKKDESPSLSAKNEKPLKGNRHRQQGNSEFLAITNN